MSHKYSSGVLIVAEIHLTCLALVRRTLSAELQFDL